MLHLIPPAWHRAGLRLAHALRKRWWRLRKPRLRGCRVVAIDRLGRVLLVRHSYGTRRWMLPGGGMARGEDPLATAARELLEETGCRAIGARLVTIVEEPLEGTTNAVHIVVARTEDEPRADGREIIEAHFFTPAALPDNCVPGLGDALPRWLAASEQR